MKKMSSIVIITPWLIVVSSFKDTFSVIVFGHMVINMKYEDLVT